MKSLQLEKGCEPSRLRLRWPDSRESIRRFARIARFSRIVSGLPGPNPFFANRFLGGGGLKIANRRFEAIRANRSHFMKIGVFLRIDLRESIHVNRPDSLCESLGRLRAAILAKKKLAISVSRSSVVNAR